VLIFSFQMCLHERLQLNNNFETKTHNPYLDAVLLAGLHVVLEVADPFAEEVQPLALVDRVRHLRGAAAVHLQRAHLWRVVVVVAIVVVASSVEGGKKTRKGAMRYK